MAGYFEGSDACVSPVLTLEEAVRHEHNLAGDEQQIDGITHPRPAPRFSRSQPGIRRSPAVAGQHTTELLGELGCSSERIATALQSCAIGNANRPIE